MNVIKDVFHNHKLKKLKIEKKKEQNIDDYLTH